ncbi:hypothetical protein SCHPADRAFT_611393 [Schizopora paradoxa]|uniref:Uncharacterized protein n=1 Tax=Schizopora paradoxa TaxID=27342 RepID=A0A0H2RFP8_9AGAM|nr:hypothetical protein SCHPADRAFT_611393 [Schizopora paradoxa]
MKVPDNQPLLGYLELGFCSLLLIIFPRMKELSSKMSRGNDVTGTSFRRRNDGTASGICIIFRRDVARFLLARDLVLLPHFAAYPIRAVAIEKRQDFRTISHLKPLLAGGVSVVEFKNEYRVV